jgi:DNA topoisomerase-1
MYMNATPSLLEKVDSLIYQTDMLPGITRHTQGKGFVFLDLHGQRITDQATLDRIKKLVIPPAWTHVWISPNPSAHLQATGRDAKGRKQYRYHPQWRELAQQHKFDKLSIFGDNLPPIRETIEGHLRAHGLTKQKVLATIVSVMEKTLIRVGNAEYARDNNSFGLTTMRDRHIRVKGQTATFDFRGKSGVDHEIKIDDPRLVKIIKACQDIPGYELFQYIDEDGKHHDIHSGDVNLYLLEITGQDITAKDFRTWGGTILATETLTQEEPAPTEAKKKKQLVKAVKEVAEHLGNKPTTARKYYIHPTVPAAHLEGVLYPAIYKRLATFNSHQYPHLQPIEHALLELVRDTSFQK